MVLGLSLSRRSKKDKENARPPLRPSPSLPELSAGGVVRWPETLVDTSSLAAARDTMDSERTTGATTKSSFQSSRAIPFHRPFRATDGSKTPTTSAYGTISSMYTSAPPSAPPSAWTGGRNSNLTRPQSTSQSARRTPRQPPTFNIMVAGATETGKSSFLRLFLQTCDISPSASSEQRAAVDRFMQGHVSRTKALRSACIEITDQRYEKVLLTVIDTPGLNFSEGRELELERSVSGIVKYLDLQFAETMDEETKVIRQSKGDQHVHLCIYLINPDSIMTPAERRAKSSLPSTTRSHTTFTYKPEDLSSISSEATSDSSSDEDEDDTQTPTPGDVAKDNNRAQSRPGMSPAEIRAIRRLSNRVNLLPVIARADTLTTGRLAAVKKAIKRDLTDEGIGFGVFGQDSPTLTPTPDDKPEEQQVEEERRSRPIIKLKAGRKMFQIKRSRSRKRLEEEFEIASPENAIESSDGPTQTEPPVSPTELINLLPFSVMSPDPVPRFIKSKSTPTANGEHPVFQSAPTSPVTPVTSSSMTAAMNGEKVDLRGRFVRKFKWGDIDVLNPEHCDVAPLRATILGPMMRTLRLNTKQVIYEAFRTEKLLARRATRNISDDDRKRLLQELGI